MKQKLFITVVLFVVFLKLHAQVADSYDFRWGNCFYYNLNVGERITFNEVEVVLLKIENHYNLMKVGNDTLWLKVARRSVPEELNTVRLFVADNKEVKALNPGSPAHGLLTKDALICLSNSHKPLLEPGQFVFPVSFNNGFTWSAEEDSYPFSFYKTNESSNSYISYPGTAFDLHDARGLQKHWLVAIENSRVVWIEKQGLGSNGNQSCILLESETYPGIYYFYNHLYTSNLAVKQGQKLKKGDAVGTAWGDESWGHFQLTVVLSDTAPSVQQCNHTIINAFPQLFELYFRQGKFISRSFARGRIVFGGPRNLTGNQINSQVFEPYSGKGWLTGRWNPADKVEWVTNGTMSNVRLKKVLFEGTPAQNKNPGEYYDYQITVRNGTYRIRAKIGDALLPSWQRIEFEGVDAGIKKLAASEYSWTGERIVKVLDGTLNIRIYVDDTNKQVAGLSEIVFQSVY